MKKKVLLICLIVICNLAYAIECNNQTVAQSDCNIIVAGTSDTSFCDLTLYNPTNDLNGRFAMKEFNAKLFFYQYVTPFAGFYYGVIECAGDTNDSIGISFTVVDSNIESYVDSLESGQTTITGNQSVIQTDLDDLNGTILDINKTTSDTNSVLDEFWNKLVDVNRYGYDVNTKITVDLNVDLYSATATIDASDVWTYSDRNLTDYNFDGTYPLWVDTNNYCYDANRFAYDANTSGGTATVDNNAVADAVWHLISPIPGFSFWDLMELFYEILMYVGG